MKMKFYTVGEEIFNAVTHGVGALLAAVAAVLLTVRAVPQGALAVAAVSVYAASMLILYTMSTLYHALTPMRAKQVFRIFDHATIFLLIAGTYTPYALLTLRGVLGWTVFGVVWGLAVFGIVMDAVMLEKVRVFEKILYVLLGWCIVLTGRTVLKNLALPGVLLLFFGGVAYTVGIFFFASKKRYMHSVWHLFVLLGSVLQFFSVLLYVL